MEADAGDAGKMAHRIESHGPTALFSIATRVSGSCRWRISSPSPLPTTVSQPQLQSAPLHSARCRMVTACPRRAASARAWLTLAIKAETMPSTRYFSIRLLKLGSASASRMAISTMTTIISTSVKPCGVVRWRKCVLADAQNPFFMLYRPPPRRSGYSGRRFLPDGNFSKILFVQFILTTH